jgi:ABC-type branched-subunit amino acid transport system substrate-binding protein
MSRHRQVAMYVILALVLVTGCGSTVHDAGTGGTGTGSGTVGGGSEGLGGSGTSGGAQLPGGSSTGSLTGGSGTTGSATGSGSGGSGATGATPAGTSGGGVGPAGFAPGVTAKEIYVGFIVDRSAGAVNEAAGIGAISSGDAKANTNAVIKDINAHGGIGGRKLVPVWAPFDSTSTQTLDQQYAAVCQQFTKDKPRVFAVLDAPYASYRQCLAQANVMMLSDSLPTVGAAEFRRYPMFLEQGYPNLDRLAAYFVTPLLEQKYFTPWDDVNGRPATTGKAKVGILTYDDEPFTHAVDTYLVPALKRLGYTPQVAKIAQVTTASDYGAQGAAVKSAQLSFAANGVTHVISFEGNGGLSTLFLPTARSQHYYPRYGVSTASATEALNEAGIVESKQLNGTVGFGWEPAVDLPTAMNPQNGPYSNANRRYCLKVMKDNGITFDSGNAEAIALSICSGLYLLKLAGDKTPAQLTVGALLRVIDSLGASYQKAGTLGEEFRPGRHDPANRAYHWRYFADCNCLHYEGRLQTIP